MDNNSIKISTGNNNKRLKISAVSAHGFDSNIINIDNNDVRYYEEQAEKYASQAKTKAIDCANYASDAKKSVDDCKNIANELEITVTRNINEHIDNTDNPHKVSAEQINVYTKTESDEKYLTSVPNEYVTETELNTKGYLTEHQDISGKANSSDLAKVATSGSYNDLSDKPVIPDGAIVDTSLSTASVNAVANKVITTSLNNKQDKLTAGDGINITDNIISTTQTSSEWGNIKGTLSNQTDLKNELEKKQDAITDLDTIRAGAAAGATALQSIPDEYVNETELNNKGFLTSNDIVTKANIDLSNCTVPYIKEISVSGTNGYIIYSNNLCKQWGRVAKSGTIAKTSSWKSTVTLSKGYGNTNYTVLVSCNYGTGTASNAGSEVGTGDMTSSSFNFMMYNRNSSATTNTIELNWVTIGTISSSGGNQSGTGGGGEEGSGSSIWDRD